MKNKKKKILWLVHEANLSGANIALIEYIDALIAVYDFHLVLPHAGNMQDAMQVRHIPVTVIPQYGWAAAEVNFNPVKRCRIFIRTALAVRATKKLLAKEKFDVVFTNTLIPFTAALAAHQLKIPHVWWIHEFGEEDFGFRIGWGKPIRAYRKMQQWSRLVVCNSAAVAKKFGALMPGTVVEYVYQPVSWKALPGIAPKKKLATCLMFGQIIPSKGHLDVLQAILEVKKNKQLDISLHIKGPCENRVYLDELFKFIELHGLQKVVKIETGFFNKEELMPLYDLLIVASTSEAFGRVIVEAGKAGLKVIVRNGGGAPELVNETNGLLYINVPELVAIFAGEKSIPVVATRQCYNEQEEINKLKSWLTGLTRV